MVRHLSITVQGEFGGIAPDPTSVLEALKAELHDTGSQLINPSVTVNLRMVQDVPVIPKPPEDCPLPNCYEPLPHTHPSL